MVKKIITWTDLQGRYRVTSPAYDSLAKELGFTEDDAINWTWTSIVASGKYGIDFDHPIHLVEDVDQRATIESIGGLYFRYGVFMLPNREGDLSRGEVVLKRDARDGAWEMDIDGRPKVDMTKARGVHMDYIRQARNKALEELDAQSLRVLEDVNVPEQERIGILKRTLRDIPQTFDLTSYTTPAALKASWPAELSPRSGKYA